MIKLNKRPKGLKLAQSQDKLVATLYDTNIVVAQHGTIHLDTGGWFTMHTKKVYQYGIS